MSSLCRVDGTEPVPPLCRVRMANLPKADAANRASRVRGSDELFPWRAGCKETLNASDTSALQRTRLGGQGLTNAHGCGSIYP